MLATLTNAAGSSVTFDADRASATWTLVPFRQFGEAEVYVPRASPAFAAVDDAGGQLVRLADPGSGTWTGVSDIPQTTAYGATLRCHHIAAATQDVVVRSAGEYRNVTAGALARVAVTMATAGHPLLRPGTFTEAAPFVPAFGYGHRALAEVLGDLANLTGQEWRVNEDGTLDWLGQIGRVVTVRLAEGDQLVDVTRQQDGEARLAEVIARGSDGSEFHAVSGEDTGWWRAQAVVDVSSTQAVRLGLEATAALLRNRAVLIQYQGNLLASASTSTAASTTLGWGNMAWGNDPWGGLYLVGGTTAIGDVREGDTLTLTLPSLHLDGRTVVARVVARTVTAGSPWIGLDLLGLPALPPTALAARAASPVLPAPADSVAGRLADAARRVAS